MAAHFLPRCITEWETARGYLTLDNAAGLFILGVFANLFYCAAYPVDLLVQYARPRGARATWRIGLFLVGALFAAALAHFTMSAALIGSPD